MLLDNGLRYAGPQVVLQLRYVELLFLPPNTTSRLQPLNAGIIAAVKAKYRRCLFSVSSTTLTREQRPFTMSTY